MSQSLLVKKSDLVAPPNLVTYARMLLALPAALLALQPGAAGWWGFGLFITAAASDKLDGWLAKRNNRRWATQLGAVLDPLVDKVLIFAALVALMVRTTQPVWGFVVAASIFLLVRELIVLAIKLGEPIASASEAGRATMVIQSIAIGLLLLPGVVPYADAAIASILVACGASATSLMMYAAPHLKRSQHLVIWPACILVITGAALVDIFSTAAFVAGSVLVMAWAFHRNR